MPNIAHAVTFGDMLKHLRCRAGLTQRALAIAVGYSHAHLTRLERNQRLPDVSVLVARFVPALDLDHAPELAARLLELATAARGNNTHEDEHTTSTFAATQATLPMPPTPLVGREALLAALQLRVVQPQLRLLTLIGPPDVGKTQLAIEVGRVVQGAFRDGVVFIALAPLTDAEHVVTALAQALGVREAPEQMLHAAVINHLRTRQMLLVLDAFEHLLHAAPLVGELLVACPKLTVLATSQVALHIYGEWVFPVVPLVTSAQDQALPPTDAHEAE